MAELHHTVGLRQYSVSDHLGNVLATVLDRKSGHGSGAYYDYWLADVSIATDYYPFGMPMQERVASPERYRLGYNGQQKSDEVYGKGNLNTALFWEYDTRLARRWNVDPVVKPHESLYVAFSGNPISYSDINGDDARVEKKPNENGKGATIIISSTVFIRGGTEEERKQYRQASLDYIAQHPENLKGSYKDENSGEFHFKTSCGYSGTQTSYSAA